MFGSKNFNIGKRSKLGQVNAKFHIHYEIELFHRKFAAISDSVEQYYLGGIFIDFLVHLNKI